MKGTETRQTAKLASNYSGNSDSTEQEAVCQNGLKEKLSSYKLSDPLRLQILSIAPESWSVKKISNEFGVS